MAQPTPPRTMCQNFIPMFHSKTAALSAPHVVKREQLFVSPVHLDGFKILNDEQNRVQAAGGRPPLADPGATAQSLGNCTQGNLGKEYFVKEIGSCVYQLLRSVPGGMGALVFFASHSAAATALRLWTDLRNERKHAYLVSLPADQRNDPARTEKTFEEKVLLTGNLVDFQRTVKEPGTISCLVTAYRSASSEGLDLKDDLCRLVVCVGIPYPPYKDTFVAEKRKFNDCYNKRLQQLVSAAGAGESGKSCVVGRLIQQKEPPSHAATAASGALEKLPTKSPMVTGDEWYASQAYRAVNQALGRCIRQGSRVLHALATLPIFPCVENTCGKSSFWMAVGGCTEASHIPRSGHENMMWALSHVATEHFHT